MDREKDGFTADVAIFDVLDGLIRSFCLDDDDLATIRARDEKLFIHYLAPKIGSSARLRAGTYVMIRSATTTKIRKGSVAQ